MTHVLIWDHGSTCLGCNEPVKPVHIEPQWGSIPQLKRVRAEETHGYIHTKMHRITMKYETLFLSSKTETHTLLSGGDCPEAYLLNKVTWERAKPPGSTYLCWSDSLPGWLQGGERGGQDCFVNSKHVWKQSTHAQWHILNLTQSMHILHLCFVTILMHCPDLSSDIIILNQRQISILTGRINCNLYSGSWHCRLLCSYSFKSWLDYLSRTELEQTHPL